MTSIISSRPVLNVIEVNHGGLLITGRLALKSFRMVIPLALTVPIAGILFLIACFAQSVGIEFINLQENAKASRIGSRTISGASII